jgi:hypothetical protein
LVLFCIILRFLLKIKLIQNNLCCFLEHKSISKVINFFSKSLLSVHRVNPASTMHKSIIEASFRYSSRWRPTLHNGMKFIVDATILKEISCDIDMFSLKSIILALIWIILILLWNEHIKWIFWYLWKKKCILNHFNIYCTFPK